MLGGAVPIEGLGLSIRLTNFLRASGITTIGRLVDVLSGADHASRSPVATRTELAEMLRFRPAQEQIRTRLAAFRKSGPVPFATLTDPETAVHDLILEGRSNKAMSAKLGVSENVIDAQLTSMYRKMQGLCALYVA
jgi:DNA-binding NarL/FixJ family response regulator